MFDPFAPFRMWHRVWVASVRAVLPTKSVRDGRVDKRERAKLAHEAQDVMDGAQAIRDAVEPPYADVTPIRPGDAAE